MVNSEMSARSECQRKMLIELHRDFVIINGITVPRPSRISRSEWLAWWEPKL